MSMLWTIAAFELRKRSRMLSTYVYFAVFFALGLVTMLAAGGAFAGVTVGLGAEKVNANVSLGLFSLLTVLSLLSLLVSAAVYGQAVHQDFEHQMHGLLFTAPMPRSTYLGGRFLGATLVMALRLSGLGLGIWLGSKMPFLERSSFGPNLLGNYLRLYAFAVLPNLLFTGAVFFTLGALTRKMTSVYTASVVLVMGYLIAGSFLGRMENRALAGWIDPFGLSAVRLLTRYWTVSEQNSRAVTLSGVLLHNRLLWMGVGVCFLVFTFARFRFLHTLEPRERRSAAKDSAIPVSVRRPVVPTLLRPQGLGWATVVVGLAWLHFRETVKSISFLVIVLAGVLFMVTAAVQSRGAYGTPTYPVTYSVLEIVGGTFGLFVLVLLTLYAGEIVWRERDARMSGLVDALPLPT